MRIHNGNSLWAALLIALTVVRTTAGPADEIRAGDTEEEVLAALGELKGRMKHGRKEVLVFHRGLVTLVDGKVEKADILSTEEATARDEARARIEAEQRAAAAQARAARIEAGLAEKSEKIEDRAFGELPARERLAYWNEFRTRYPEVAVDSEIAAARREVNKAEAEAEAEQRAALDEKIRETEQALEEARGRTGLGRTGLKKLRADIRELSRELEDLQKQRRELGE